MTDQAPAAPADAGQAQPGQGSDAAAGNPNPGAQPAGDAKPWYDGHNLAPEDVGYIQNKKWNSPADVLTSYKNLEKFHGVPADQLLKLPKDEKDQAAWDALYTRLGRPEKPEGYEFKAPEGVKLDDARMSWVNGVAHKIGLSKAQHAALVNETLTYEGRLISEAQKAVETQQAAELEAVKKEWGAGFEERSELGRRAARAFLPGTAEEKQAFMNAMEMSIGTGAMLKLFANIGEKLGEDKIHAGDDGGRPFGYTKEQALSDIKGLMTELRDPSNKERLTAYNQGKGKDYEKMQHLNKIAYGNAA